MKIKINSQWDWKEFSKTDDFPRINRIDFKLWEDVLLFCGRKSKKSCKSWRNELRLKYLSQNKPENSYGIIERKYFEKNTNNWNFDRDFCR